VTLCRLRHLTNTWKIMVPRDEAHYKGGADGTTSPAAPPHAHNLADHPFPDEPLCNRVLNCEAERKCNNEHVDSYSGGCDGCLSNSIAECNSWEAACKATVRNNSVPYYGSVTGLASMNANKIVRSQSSDPARAQPADQEIDRLHHAAGVRMRPHTRRRGRVTVVAVAHDRRH
jgi:hypothetical protein